MPYVDRSIEEIILLYQRCKEWKTLPLEGGLMDQPESIIIYFDVIAGAVAEHQKEERERMEFDNQQKSLERVWNAGR